MISKFKYRFWQFWQSLEGSPGESEWQEIERILSPTELSLFKQLPIPDQNHSVRVLRALEANHEGDPDLLKAALLHDLGKIKHPLRRWERVFAVLVMGIFPRRHLRWGTGDPSGLKRALVVIKQHPHWGADLADEAGSNPMTVWLIRNHETRLSGGSHSSEDLLLLNKLQKADNQN
jgi:hypothetical protein